MPTAERYRRHGRTREEIRAEIARLDQPLEDPTNPGQFVERDPAVTEALRKRLELQLLTTPLHGRRGRF